MTASAWSLFDVARKHIGNNTVNLSTTTGWNMSLHKTAASANLVGDVTTWGSIGSELASGNGYTAGGKALTSVVWTTGASAGQYKWDVGNRVFTASGGALTSIRYAVIFFSVGATSGYPLCYAALSTAAFSVSSGSTMTVQINPSGVFTLT